LLTTANVARDHVKCSSIAAGVLSPHWRSSDIPPHSPGQSRASGGARPPSARPADLTVLPELPDTSSSPQQMTTSLVTGQDCWRPGPADCDTLGVWCVICGSRRCLLCCVVVAAGVVLGAESAEAWPGNGALAAALEEIGRLQAENAELRVSLAEVLARDAEREAELEKLRADFAVLQRMLFGRSSEKSRPEPAVGDGGGDDAGGGGGDGGQDRGRGSGRNVKRGPGARAGRRDYSHLPRFEVFWDFPGGGYCCPECGEPFSPLSGHWSGEQLDWQVIVRVAAHCRRRYKRECACRVPATVMAPGPPKAIGKGLFTDAFIAMLLTERYVAGRSMNSLVTGFSRQGAEVSPATLAGTCAQAGGLLAPLAEAITERSRGSWHLHADETTWRVFAPRDGDGPAKWWLWVFTAPRGAVSYRPRSGQRWEEIISGSDGLLRSERMTGGK
jgi:transposase